MNSTPSLFTVQMPLGVLEQEIFSIVLQEEDITVREAVAIMNQKRHIAYTTVLTVMEHLVRKGFLTHEKEGKSYRYTPVREKESFVRHAIQTSMYTMIRTYGVRTLLLSFLPIPSLYGSFAYKYQKPVLLSFSLMVIGGLFALSLWNWFEQIHISGFVDYISLFFTEPKLIQNDIRLFTLTIMESFPLAQSVILSVLCISIVSIVKRLMKLFANKRALWANVGGIAV